VLGVNKGKSHHQWQTRIGDWGAHEAGLLDVTSLLGHVDGLDESLVIAPILKLLNAAVLHAVLVVVLEWGKCKVLLASWIPEHHVAVVALVEQRVFHVDVPKLAGELSWHKCGLVRIIREHPDPEPIELFLAGCWHRPTEHEVRVWLVLGGDLGWRRDIVRGLHLFSLLEAGSGWGVLNGELGCIAVEWHLFSHSSLHGGWWLSRLTGNGVGRGRRIQIHNLPVWSELGANIFFELQEAQLIVFIDILISVRLPGVSHRSLLVALLLGLFSGVVLTNRRNVRAGGARMIC
jgi:hypothetical protein